MITTPRLILRQWKDSDYAPFAAMNADPVVRKFFPGLLPREESDAMIDRVRKFIDANGYGFWAVEIPGVTDFAGFTGITQAKFAANFTPCTEIGWRLATAHHGKGYATEGALASLKYAFEELKLPEIYSFTAPANVNSWRVMEKIGMTRVGEFEHPNIEEGHPLKTHVLYKKVRT